MNKIYPKSIVVFTIFFITWVVAIAYIVDKSLPYNVVHLPGEEKFSLTTILPQGWNFFTKDPRSMSNFYYFYDDKIGWKEANLPVNGHYSNWFGVKRTTRAQGIEFGALQMQIPDSTWSNCTVEHLECFNLDTNYVYIKNTSYNPTLCGLIGVIRRPPVPWAWSSVPTVTMPGHSVQLRISCQS